MLTLSSQSQQLLHIIHKSNVLSVTDGLFREVIRGIPASGKYPDVTVAEQLVDSAVYGWGLWQDGLAYDKN